MSILGVNGTLAGAYQHADRTQKTAANGASFTEQLQKTGESGALKADAYTEYLKQKYGAGVSIRNVGKDQSSIDRCYSLVYLNQNPFFFFKLNKIQDASI